ncbi:MAG: rRNA maturation RNase YbeY [Leptolyngbyaceae bacterium]|nr:rRNA maturation RNase YbeY [Leptolyngbyaceae bacterium]
MQVEVNVQDCFSEAFQEPNTLENKHSESEPVQTTPSDRISTQTWENWFQRWLELLQLTSSNYLPLHPDHAYEVTLRLTNDQEVQALNAQYRSLDQPTDVLAFAALEVDCPQPEDELAATLPLYLGDIVISVDTAQRQAQQQGHSDQTELAWLASHGLLHLLGWDHPDEIRLGQMLDQQKRLLQAVGFTHCPV